MKVYIDGDGCSVVDIVIRNCVKYKLECFIVCNTSHIFEKENATTITVSKGADSADFEIIKRVSKEDLIVTQDYGLAALGLSKGCFVIRLDGVEYTNYNIDSMLYQRYSAQKIRKSGGRLKGSSKRTAEDDIVFEKSLVKLIERELS